MDEKLKFVSRYLDGEKISTLCQEFGISRVTGHKIIERYKDRRRLEQCCGPKWTKDINKFNYSSPSVLWLIEENNSEKI